MASSTSAPPPTAPARQKPTASSKSVAVPPAFSTTDHASTLGIQEIPPTEDELSPSEDDQCNSQLSAPTTQMASPTSSTPAVPSPSVAIGTPCQLSTLDTWTQIEVDQVIFHSRDKCDHEANGEEFWRAVASRLVKDGQVLHPSLLNPHTPPRACCRQR